MAETVVTTTSMTAESWSTRTAQSALKSPVENQENSTVVRGVPPKFTSKKVIQDMIAQASSRPEVMYIAGLSPRRRLPSPAMSAPIRGSNTIQASISASAVHHVDVFDRDRAAVAEIDHQDRKTDRGFRGRHGQHEHGEDLPHHVAEEMREGDQVDVDREQHQLDRHQDDDDVLAVQEDAEDPDGEQDRRDGQVVREGDFHGVTPHSRS